jgi:hypothetical protein
MIPRLVISPEMVEMVDRILRNSDRATRRALKKYIKKNINPFKKDVYGTYRVEDDSILSFLNQIYLHYLYMPEEERAGFRVQLQRS